MSSFPPFRVKLWDIASSDRSRNTLKAVITDARDIGVSSYANAGGEMFFTLPWNHPKIAECVPWQRHYEATRYNPSTGGYDVVGVGLLNDYDADPNEVIFYGIDYLACFNASISASNTSYTGQDYGTIIAAEISAAVNQTSVGGKSVTKHITLGTIESTSQTTTVLTSFQPRLQFAHQLLDVYQSDSSVRPIVSVTRSTPFTFSFLKNAGSDKQTRAFNYGGYGGLVSDFRYVPGFADFGTRGQAIGQKREGASILFSTQTYASEATYGIIAKSTLFIDIVNQAALDRKAKRFARDIGTVGKNIALGLRVQGVGPWEWGELADSIPVVIDRGIVSVNGLHTVWGQEWIGKADGSEDLFLSILPKET